MRRTIPGLIAAGLFALPLTASAQQWHRPPSAGFHAVSPQTGSTQLFVRPSHNAALAPQHFQHHQGQVHQYYSRPNTTIYTGAGYAYPFLGYYGGYLGGYLDDLSLGYYPNTPAVIYQPYPVYQYEPVPVYQPPVVIDATPPAMPRDRAGADDYYLHRATQPADPGVAQAMADIELAFRTSNPALLAKHVDEAGSIAVTSGEEARATLTGGTYLGRSRDAIAHSETVRYELNQAEPARDGAWRVTGVHVLREEHLVKQYEIGFLLRKHGDRWIIVEASAGRAM